MSDRQLTTIQQRQVAIRGLLEGEKFRAEIAKALPKLITPDRFIRVAVTCMNKVPKLAECSQSSLLGAMLTCAQLGIEPDGRRAHLIPYKDQCQLIIDYKGYIELAKRSGEVKSWAAELVKENDEFSWENGVVKHAINWRQPRGKTQCVYSRVQLKDGTFDFDVMTLEEVEAIRKRSRAADNGPWKTDFDEMAKKTVIRRHSKRLTLSPEFMDASEVDDDTVDEVQVRKAKVVTPVGSDDVPFSFGEPAQISDEQPVNAGAGPEGSTVEPLARKVEPDAPGKLAAQAELPGTERSDVSPVEKLVSMAAGSGIPFDAVEAWAKARKLDASKDADAAKIILAWKTVSETIRAKGGAS